MAHVITQNCCKDASCVAVCPVDCIRPDPADAGSAPMLYIDPEVCIDCGACMAECPVDAIYPADELPADQLSFRDLNADYFARHPLVVTYAIPEPSHPPVPAGALRVAIVGTGPAALYAAGDLLRVGGVEVNLFDRLPTPYGLIRAGVAPDHQHTKAITDSFETILADDRVGCYLNVEVGRDLTPDELAASHHAVIYAVGASRSRDLGIPGESLPGSHAASQFVAWYNGHPDRADDRYDLRGPRAVIVGNGNVALDVARILLMTQQQLQHTDIPARAVEALAHSAIREVVLLGRRGARHAAFSAAELIALGHLPGTDIVVEARDLAPTKDDDVDTAAKLRVLAELSSRPTNPSNKRIVFRFDTVPIEFIGTRRVEAVKVSASGLIEAGFVLRSIGYRGDAIAGLPFDSTAGVIANDGGRVTDGGRTVPGAYVTGWIKRGANGVIGTNRECARETVNRIWADFDAGVLARGVIDVDLPELLGARGVRAVDALGWRAIDAEERARGAEQRRPRVKFDAVADMLQVARA
ncbi:FAD-dependent oxidoreductase [Mycolicibacterium bacteremicum]|uniref:ferredoxin--NADP(+) reductase n=1 Tax=Mycolicibacterium bacteremicum TaxID=564198 RepID=A0A1W9YWG2_MYCBA|nr:FAD-dependent oxidoreductase [Mycolicibacterium bacteremicum]MCV7431563.1 FAD-dependent oxidoreductase [Mycolicibacterium bacteremicum]ORA04393.1 ferredoxin [Mycolicibacterium bacteremicum]